MMMTALTIPQYSLYSIPPPMTVGRFDFLLVEQVSEAPHLPNAEQIYIELSYSSGQQWKIWQRLKIWGAKSGGLRLVLSYSVMFCPT